MNDAFSHMNSCIKIDWHRIFFIVYPSVRIVEHYEIENRVEVAAKIHSNDDYELGHT